MSIGRLRLVRIVQFQRRSAHKLPGIGIVCVQPGGLLRQGIAHHRFEMIVSKWLRDVVVSAFAQCFDRGLDTGIRSYDDAHHFGIEVANPPQQIETAPPAAKVQVEDRQVYLLAFENLEGACASVGFQHLVTFAAQ